VTPLNGAIANTYGPGGTEVIGYDLNFDVMRSRHLLFQKDGGIPESLESFGSCSIKSSGQFIRRTYFSNPAAPAAGGSLDEEWILQPRRLLDSLSSARDLVQGTTGICASSARRSKQSCRPPITFGRRSDEYNAHVVTEPAAAACPRQSPIPPKRLRHASTLGQTFVVHGDSELPRVRSKAAPNRGTPSHRLSRQHALRSGSRRARSREEPCRV
jgi:hypothetical protein